MEFRGWEITSILNCLVCCCFFLCCSVCLVLFSRFLWWNHFLCCCKNDGQNCLKIVYLVALVYFSFKMSSYFMFSYFISFHFWILVVNYLRAFLFVFFFLFFFSIEDIWLRFSFCSILKLINLLFTSFKFQCILFRRDVFFIQIFGRQKFMQLQWKCIDWKIVLYENFQLRYCHFIINNKTLTF